MKPTIFCDIDGTLIRHKGTLHSQITEEPELLPGVLEKLNQWVIQDATIVLITGRKESTRNITEQQLQKLGIPYDMLIMGLGRGKRVVVNDKKPNSEENNADSYSPIRNVGLANCPF